MYPRTMLGICLATIFCGTAGAAVTQEEAKKLGGPELTEWGAERAGNKDGTIPAYTGERIKVPAAYDPKEPGQYPDPFGDKPLHSITAQNMDKHADRLTEGQKGMLKKYPAFRMDVYQSHRTAAYPKFFIDNTLKNATSCKAVQAGLKLEGCYGGMPFPIPKTGNEVVWNHNTRFAYASFGGGTQAWIVDANGKQILQGVLNAHESYFPFYDPKRTTPLPSDSTYWRLRFDYLAPARQVGQKYVIIDSLDAVGVGRRAYVYVPGQRRVKLAPDLSYDTPSPASGGASTMDEQAVFLGAQDRYDMKLAGKKEIFLMYNTNKAADYKTCPPEVGLTKNFLNPDCVRWEVHRTWVVEASIRPGVRHILPKRTMYFDEDTPGAGAGDSYDAAGKLYRVDYAPHTLIYTTEPPASMAEQSVTYDLQTGVVANSSYLGFKGGGWVQEENRPDTFFSPEALAGEGIR